MRSCSQKSIPGNLRIYASEVQFWPSFTGFRTSSKKSLAGAAFSSGGGGGSGGGARPAWRGVLADVVAVHWRPGTHYLGVAGTILLDLKPALQQEEQTITAKIDADLNPPSSPPASASHTTTQTVEKASFSFPGTSSQPVHALYIFIRELCQLRQHHNAEMGSPASSRPDPNSNLDSVAAEQTGQSAEVAPEVTPTDTKQIEEGTGASKAQVDQQRHTTANSGGNEECIRQPTDDSEVKIESKHLPHADGNIEECERPELQQVTRSANQQSESVMLMNQNQNTEHLEVNTQKYTKDNEDGVAGGGGSDAGNDKVVSEDLPVSKASCDEKSSASLNASNSEMKNDDDAEDEGIACNTQQQNQPSHDDGGSRGRSASAEGKGCASAPSQATTLESSVPIAGGEDLDDAELSDPQSQEPSSCEKKKQAPATKQNDGTQLQASGEINSANSKPGKKKNRRKKNKKTNNK